MYQYTSKGYKFVDFEPPDRRIKAISLWQPWASLIAIGSKQYETRSWATNYRGLLAIHATKRWTKLEQEMLRQFHRIHGAECWYLPHPLPLGAVVCVCKLTAIYRTEELYPKIEAPERAFGNYATGRFAWRLELVKVYDEPISTKGAQGLWDWTPPASL